MRPRLTCTCGAVLAVSLVAFGGCGRQGPDYGALDLSSVRGTVTLDDEPLAEALVVFEAEDQTFSYALTDENGDYDLMFNSEKRGVTKGKKTVRIWSSRRAPGTSEAGGSGDEDDPDAPPDERERVPAEYNERSKLSVIIEDSSHDFDFDL